MRPTELHARGVGKIDELGASRELPMRLTAVLLSQDEASDGRSFLGPSPQFQTRGATWKRISITDRRIFSLYRRSYLVLGQFGPADRSENRFPRQIFFRNTGVLYLCQIQELRLND